MLNKAFMNENFFTWTQYKKLIRDLFFKWLFYVISEEGKRIRILQLVNTLLSKSTCEVLFPNKLTLNRLMPAAPGSIL